MAVRAAVLCACIAPSVSVQQQQQQRPQRESLYWAARWMRSSARPSVPLNVKRRGNIWLCPPARLRHFFFFFLYLREWYAFRFCRARCWPNTQKPDHLKTFSHSFLLLLLLYHLFLDSISKEKATAAAAARRHLLCKKKRSRDGMRTLRSTANAAPMCFSRPYYWLRGERHSTKKIRTSECDATLFLY
jgi:hypothetical protein